MASLPEGGQSTEVVTRYGHLIRIIAISGVAILAITIGAQIYTNTRLVVIGLTSLGAIVLLAFYRLTQIGHTNFARYALPLLSWLIVNTTLLQLPSFDPLLFVGINSVILLLAGALFDHNGVLIAATFTVLLGIGIFVAGLDGLISVALHPVENWSSASSVFALVSLFCYYTFRDRRRAMLDANRKAEEIETLLQASQAVAASLEMEETIERILVQLERVVPYHSASVQILKDGALEIVGGRGWDDSAEVIGIQFPVPGDNPNTKVIKTRETYILDDAPEEFEAFRQPPHNHIRSMLSVPLMLGDELIGMLGIDHRQPRFFNQSHAHLARAFADQVALAITNAQHFKAEQRRRQLAAMQQDITQITSASLELDEVIQRISSLSCQTLEADIAVILVQPQHGAVEQSIELHRCNPDISDELVAEIENDLLPNLTQDVLKQTVPQFGAARLNLALSNLSGQSADFLRQWFENRQGLIVPLIAAGHSTGIMLMVRLSPDPLFDESSIATAETIAQSVATSIENASLYSQMEQMAITDSLTGLYNRRGLSQMGQREIDRARRFDRAFSVLMLDLDLFKELNDTYGHAAGDEVLRQLAELLTELVRSIDVVARYGGEEVTILLPECPQDCAEQVADRLRQAVESHAFQTNAGELEITISLGLASGSNMPLDLEALIDAADRALYGAKEAGRNQTWSWHPEGPRPVSQ